MSRSEGESGEPQAIIHKRILDVAEANPDASLAGIAENVTGASIDLVERVLEKYGDPGEDSGDVSGDGNQANGPSDYENDTGGKMTEGDTTAESAPDRNGDTQDVEETNGDTQEVEETNDETQDVEETNGETPDVEETNGDTQEVEETNDETQDVEETNDETQDVEETNGDTQDANGAVGGENAPVPDRSDLSDKQVDALRRIRANPDATQRELAEELDVTAATVSRWLNDIPGFGWERRRSFVSKTLNGTEEVTGRNGDRDAEPGDGESPGAESGLQRAIEDLQERVGALEEETAESCEGRELPLDTDLLHKVIHACMASDRITEAEELRILDGLIGDDS